MNDESAVETLFVYKAGRSQLGCRLALELVSDHVNERVGLVVERRQFGFDTAAPVCQFPPALIHVITGHR